MDSRTKLKLKHSPFKRPSPNWSETYGCQFVAFFDDVACPICHDVVKDPHVTSCCEGHFCDCCIHRILDSKSSCPLCREPQFEVVPSKKCNLKVQSLAVYCKMKDQGCPWKGALRERTAHLDAKDGNCSYVEVECPNKCGVQVIRNSMALHVQVACSKSESACPYCSEKLTKGQLAMHLNVCLALPLPCPNLCGVGSASRIERRQMERHLQECSLQPVECEFFYAGCTDKIKRRDVTKHMEEGTQAHLSMLSAFVAKSFKKFEQQSEQLLKKDGEIVALQNELRELKLSVSVPPVEFVLKDYKRQFTDSKEWLSPDFYTHCGGYLLCLHAVKEAGEVGLGTCRLALSAKVREGRCDAMLTWPCRCTVGVQVVIHGNTICKTVAVSLSPKATLPLLQVQPGRSLSNKLTICVLKIELT